MYKKLAVLALVVALPAVLAASCSPSGPTTPKSCAPTGSVAHRNLRYASSAGVAAGLQSLDLYVPVRPAGCAATPVVAYVHGGAFQNGDKANQLADKVNLFTKEGWSFASLNYRLVGNPGSGSTNGVYPAAEQDVAAGIAYLSGHAAQYGLDASRIMLLGHSSGAFLVSIVSADGSFLQASGLGLKNVRCTASLDTTYDIPTQVAGGGLNAAMYLAAFGQDPAVWAKGSPTHNVAAGKAIPSFHIVTRGARDRVAEAQAFGTELHDAGVTEDVQVVTGLDHEQVNDAVGQAGDTVVTPALMSFYRTCAK
jgi:acetyl esterase/lipase